MIRVHMLHCLVRNEAITKSLTGQMFAMLLSGPNCVRNGIFKAHLFKEKII